MWKIGTQASYKKITKKDLRNENIVILGAAASNSPSKSPSNLSVSVYLEVHTIY